MKKVLMIAVLMAVSSSSFAWIEKASQQKSYDFKFKIKSDTFTFTRSAASYEEAFETAANACFKHYKGGRRVSEEEGLDIIDVCANPRS